MTISKIVSGGQTGVDQGALDACRLTMSPYGGWGPKGRKSEDGPLPSKDGGVDFRDALEMGETIEGRLGSPFTLI